MIYRKPTIKTVAKSRTPLSANFAPPPPDDPGGPDDNSRSQPIKTKESDSKTSNRR